jgi:hypothetical protein
MSRQLLAASSSCLPQAESVVAINAMIARQTSIVLFQFNIDEFNSIHLLANLM